MYERAKFAARQGDFEEAYRLNGRAYELLSPGKPTYSSVMAAKYQQGWICMQRGDDTEPLRFFREALAICQLNEVQRGNQRESARVKWRISQILEKQGLEEEAK